MLVPCKHGSFPDLALFELAVAEERIDAVIFLIDSGCKCHAARCRNSLSEGTRTHIESWEILHGRMSLQAGAELAEGLKLFLREVPFLCHNGIKRRAGMSLGKDEAITVRVLRVLRIDMHFLKIKESVDVSCGE